MPSVGLTRSYQEQANQVVDKYYAFSARLTELIHHLNVPMDDASRIVREQMEGMAKGGGIDVQNKEFYDKWVATLESNYMEMFKSPDYLQLLYRTVDSYSDFLTAQQQVYGNSLSSLPIATTKDMDELSKEIYMLKKKLRQLSKKMESEGASAPDSGNGHQHDGQQ
jgi:polyhydroxyalkanoate synthesis regulator phasin